MKNKLIFLVLSQSCDTISLEKRLIYEKRGCQLEASKYKYELHSCEIESHTYRCNDKNKLYFFLFSVHLKSYLNATGKDRQWYNNAMPVNSNYWAHSIYKTRDKEGVACYFIYGWQEKNESFTVMGERRSKVN